MKYRQLCYFCMQFSDKITEECPVCGRKYKNISANVRLLPEGSILASNYIVGHCKKMDGYENEYAGYDIKKGQKVSIYEFFPKNLGIERNTTETFSVSTESDADDVCYQEYIDAYVDRIESLLDISEEDSTLQKIQNYFYENNTAYLICEYVDGISLSELSEQMELSYNHILTIGNAIIDLVKTGHKKEFFFCDVSSENIIIQDGGQIRLLVSGAGGVGKYVYIKETQAKDMLRSYYPSEMTSYTDTIMEKTDVYMVSVLLYELLSGASFQMESKSISKTTKYKKVFKSILNAIDNGLGINSSKRSENFNEFTDIQKFNGGKITVSHHKTTVSFCKKERHINRNLCCCLIAAFIMAVVFFVSLSQKTEKDAVHDKSESERKKIVAELVTNEPAKKPVKNTIQPTTQASISVNIDVGGSQALYSPSPSPEKSAVKSADLKKKHIKKKGKIKKHRKKNKKKVNNKRGVAKKVATPPTPEPKKYEHKQEVQAPVTKRHIPQKKSSSQNKKKSTRSSEKVEKYTEESISGLK